MKKIILILMLLIVVFNTVEARSFKAVVRTQNNLAKEDMVELEDLISDTSFDGKYFKIVNGKSDEAINFDADEKLVFRAATVYYHLTRARNYFVEKIKSDFVGSGEKIIVRIELANQFSELGHFANDNLEPQLNNALTIPGGRGLPSKGVKPWGTEIWFRPSKKIRIDMTNSNNFATQNFKSVLRSYRNQMHMQSFQMFLMTAITAVNVGAPTQNLLSLDSVFRTAGSSVIMESVYQFFGPINRLLSRKEYWLDTALIPEIIYHEYSHAALSDHLELTHSTPIIEGMADFFAGQIAGSPELAKHIKKYNTFNGKDAKKKQDYRIQFEMNDYANTDFVFGLLWEIKNILGEEKGEEFMFELRKHLTTNSTIRGELIEGIIKTCDDICTNPFIDKIHIFKALNLRGI